MTSYQEIIQRSISAAIQKIQHPERKGWVMLSEGKLKENKQHLIRVNAFLERHPNVKILLENLARLIIKNKSLDDKFVETSNAQKELHLKSKAVVTISLQQDKLTNSILETLWTKELYLAAGRMMRAATLGIDPDPIDVGIVNEAERRGPLLLEYANHIWLRIVESDLTKDVVQEAMDNIPAQKPIIWERNKHPLEGVDDTINTYLKNFVSNKLWTSDVLMAAGRIAAMRSLARTPSWDDVELVYKADHLSRWTIINTSRIIREQIKNDEEVFPEEIVKNTLAELEEDYNQPDTSEDAGLKEIPKKIYQHIWISCPDYIRAKANLEKHGLYDTAHGDVMMIHSAQAFEKHLYDNIMTLLTKKNEKILEKSQSSLTTWLWNNKIEDKDKLHFTSNEVSHELVGVATHMVYRVKH